MERESEIEAFSRYLLAPNTSSNIYLLKNYQIKSKAVIHLLYLGFDDDLNSVKWNKRIT